MRLQFIVFAYFEVIVSVYSANILCLLPFASPSHHIWNKSLINGLAERGHNLTVISPEVERKVPNNVHYIHLENVYNTIYNGSEKIDIIEMANLNNFEEVLVSFKFIELVCTGALQSQGLSVLLNYPKDFPFDLILHDFTGGPCLLGFAEYFNSPPIIAISAFLIPPQKTQTVGGHNYPAYLPYFSLPYDTEMNFFQRVHNVLLYAFDLIYREYIFLPAMDQVMNEAFGAAKTSYATDIDQRTVLMLVNSHESFNFPEPIAPNVIPVAGQHIKEGQPLPADIEAFIQQGQKGAVLFSLGTNVRSDMLSPEKLKMFLDAFKQIPEYNFLWKFESDLKLPLSANVMIKSWLPQNDILAHANTRAFITHSGGLSTQEATWHGVPMIGIPFIVDQYRNIHKAVKADVAIELTFSTLTTSKIVEAVKEILTNPRYRESMNKRSKRFKDQPEKPLTKALWWIEWVLRHPNPDHIQSPVIKLGFLAGNCLDVYILFLCLGLSFVYALKYCFSKIFFSKSKHSINKSKKIR